VRRRWVVRVVVIMGVFVRVAAAISVHMFMDVVMVRRRAFNPDFSFTATARHTHRLSPH
jgi:hypothetical protein